MRRTTTLLFLLFGLTSSLALGACRSQRRAWTPSDSATTTTTGGAGTVAATGTVASGTPREQLEQLDSVLRPAGFAPTGPAVHGNLQTNGLIAYAVDALPNTCYALTVIGEAAGQNLDMIVLDPYGRPASHNVRPDNHPWVSFCAGAAGRFIARVQMASGSGGYYFAPYASSGGQRIELSAFFGDQPTEQVQVAQMDNATQTRLQRLDGLMTQRNYTRVGEPSGVVLQNPEPRDFELNLVSGQCYGFAALGGPGTQEVDIALNDSSGQRLSQDTNTGQDGSIAYCAQATGSYSLQVRVASGQGSLFTVGYVQNGGGGANQPVIATTSTAGAGLQENFALLDADMRARGYVTLGEQTVGRLAQGAEQTYPVQLEGGRCYAILAVGDAGVQDLDLRLEGPSGREIDRDTADGPRPTVRVCARTSGTYTMHVQLGQGAGQYVYASYRWPRGTQGPFGMEGVTWVRMSEVTALLSVEGYAPDPGFTPGEGQLRQQGATATHQVEFAAGECYAVVVVGGEGVSDLDVTLARNGTQLASDYGSRNAFPSVRQCAQQAGTYSFQITAADGSGEYHYQIFHRSEDP
ncbi:MAG: hypothetical protein AB8I08_14695 [Sandaracinaceae bacterium]